MDQFTGVLEVQLPPTIKSIDEPPIDVSSADISADDLFAIAAAYCKQLNITLHSSYIKKVSAVPTFWHADVSSPVSFKGGERLLRVVVVKKEVVVELKFLLFSDEEQALKAKQAGKDPKKAPTEPMAKRVDGVAVNFRGIPTQIKTSDEFSKFLGFKSESMFKVTVNTFKKLSVEGEEFTLSRGTGRIIFLRKDLPTELKPHAGELKRNLGGRECKVSFYKDKKKREREEDPNTTTEKRRKLLAKQVPRAEEAEKRQAPDGNSEHKGAKK